MTTIVFRDGVMAADSRLSESNATCGSIKKIRQVGDFVFGLSGVAYLYEEFEKFIGGVEYDRELFKREDADFFAIVVNKKTKDIAIWSTGLTAEKFEADYHVTGSGRQFATGALLMGASAQMAVEMAAKVDHKTGGDIQVVRVW